MLYFVILLFQFFLHFLTLFTIFFCVDSICCEPSKYPAIAFTIFYKCFSRISFYKILAKLDGVNAIPNVLLIGMTNRRELLDVALLRPGRLEVQIEIPLPDKEGRREILQIHFDALRRRGRLSKPLCCAIDGVKHVADDEGGDEIISSEGKRSKRQKLKKLIRRSLSSASSFDLAADSVTGGWSGADLQGLVRCAGEKLLLFLMTLLPSLSKDVLTIIHFCPPPLSFREYRTSTFTKE